MTVKPYGVRVDAAWVEQAGRDLKTAWKDRVHVHLSDQEAEWMSAIGWTPADAGFLADLADLANAYQPFWFDYYGAIVGVRGAMAHMAEPLANVHSRRGPEGVTWLAVLAGSGSPEAFSDLEDLIVPDSKEQQQCFALWLSQNLGMRGPLAYAAGLSPVDAAERCHADTLTLSGLVVLAGLRGYRLPPVEVLQALRDREVRL
jgi:hypothetical protein